MKKERSLIQSHARGKILPVCDNPECPILAENDPGCVKTKKWPSEIVFKPSKFSDEARSLAERRYRLHD
jgi:hypothetical protein